MTAHTTRTEEQKVALAQEVIVYLNEILVLDPAAIHNLCEKRVQANDALTLHETTQIGVLDDDPEKVGVGLIGILNGLVGVRDDQWGYITAVHGDDDKLQRFELTRREGDVEVKEEMHPDVGERPVTDVDAGMIINGNRRAFVEGVQYYLNELLDDDSPLHVIGHIESLCRDYEKLIRDAVKVYGTDSAPSLVKSDVVVDQHDIRQHARWIDRSGQLIIIRDSNESTTAWTDLRPDGAKGADRFMTTAGFRRAYRWVLDL